MGGGLAARYFASIFRPRRLDRFLAHRSAFDPEGLVDAGRILFPNGFLGHAVAPLRRAGLAEPLDIGRRAAAFANR